MLFVHGPNTINHSLALKKVFLAKQGVRLLVRRIGAYYLADKALAAVFIYTTLRRVHLKQSTRLMGLGLFGLSDGYS